MDRTLDRRLLVGIALLVGVFVVNSGIALHNIRLLDETNEQVRHTQEVLGAVRQVLAAAQDAETGQRGFLITGNPRYLAPFDAAVAAIEQDLQQTKQLTKNNPSQQARLGDLKQHVEAKLRELRTTIDLRKKEGFEAARRIVQTDAGQNEMEAVRKIIAEMADEERNLLDMRTEAARNSRNIAIVGTLVMALLALLMLGAFAGLLRRHLLDRARAADALHSQKEMYRMTLASIGDAVIATDTNGLVTMLNPVAESLTGWNIADAANVPLPEIFRIVNEETRQAVENPALRALADGVIVGLANHTLLISKDGTERPIDDSAAPIRNSAGETAGAVLVFRDITERRSADQALSERMELLALGADISAALVRGHTLRDMLQSCAQALVERLDAAFARFWTLNEHTSTLELQASAGLYTHLDGPHGRVPVGQFKIGLIARDRKPHLTNAVIGDSQVPEQDWARREGMVSFAGYPLLVEDRVIGVMAMFAQHSLPPQTLETMAAIADEIAIGIEHKRGQDNLRQQQEWLRTTLASIGDAVIASDVEGRVTFMNPVAQSLTGWQAEDAQGKPLETVFRIVNEHTRQIAENPVVKVLEEGRAVGLANHALLISRTGTSTPIDDSAAPIKDDQGTTLGVVLIFRDVSEQRRAAEARKDREQHLRLALEAGRMGTWEWNIQTNQVLWSPSLEAIHGILEGTFPGTFEAYRQDMHPQDRERVLGSIARAVEGGGDHFAEYRIVWPDGAEHWIEARGKVFRDSAGTPTRMIGVCVNIDERKRVEHSLRFLAQSSAILGTLVDYESTLQQIASLAVPDFADWCMVDLLNADGRLERLAIAHGDPAKATLAWQLSERYPADADSHYGARHVLSTGNAELVPEISEKMIEQLAVNPEHLRMLQSLDLRSYLCVPVKAQDRVLGALTFITAESGRRYAEFELNMAEGLANRAAVAIENARLYRDLREADHRKDEFLAMLAHELRNPLAPIRNALELLTPETDSATAQWAKNLMQRQVQHIVRLVDDLLDVSRVMRGKIQLKKEPVEVASAIQHAVEEAKPAMDSQEQEFSISLPNSPLWVQADPNRLSQIVSNLLANAAKYTDRKGKISLSASPSDSQVTIAVRDTGIGIEPSMLEHIFEPFTQITDSLDRSRGGLGIGLALVKNLVEMHDGTVTARSAGLGKGSEFCVRLPLVVHGDPSVVSQWQPTPVRARKVLVVDDNLGSAQTLAKLLTKFWGHQVDMAHDGPSTLVKVEQFRPDVVLLDIGLPGLSGYDVAAHLRARPQFDRILLVALTGYGQDADRRRSTAAGFDEHLVKPASAKSLQELFNHPKLMAG